MDDRTQRLLRELGLDRHIPFFKQQEIDYDALLYLTADDLQGLPVGPRVKLLRRVDELRGGHKTTAPATSTTSTADKRPTYNDDWPAQTSTRPPYYTHDERGTGPPARGFASKDYIDCDQDRPYGARYQQALSALQGTPGSRGAQPDAYGEAPAYSGRVQDGNLRGARPANPAFGGAAEARPPAGVLAAGLPPGPSTGVGSWHATPDRRSAPPHDTAVVSYSPAADVSRYPARTAYEAPAGAGERQQGWDAGRTQDGWGRPTQDGWGRRAQDAEPTAGRPGLRDPPPGGRPGAGGWDGGEPGRRYREDDRDARPYGGDRDGGARSYGARDREAWGYGDRDRDRDARPSGERE
eukprot:EG_transcript_17871